MFTNITSFMMLGGMFGSRHNLKIFNSVIKFITIDMVDYFTGLKRSAYLFFHDEAVDRHCFAIMADCFVTMSNVHSIGRSLNSFKASIYPKFVVVLFTQTSAKSWPITTFNFARNVFDTIWPTNQMRSAIFALQHVVISAKTFCKLGFVASLNFADKILDTIGTSTTFIFHDDNLTLFDNFVKQNLRG